MPFTCEHCHYTTTVKSTFNDHLKSKRHLDNLSAPAPFSCDRCRRGFKTKCGLRLHKTKCQNNEATEVSNAIVCTEVITKEMFDKHQEEMNNKIVYLQNALMECMRRQAVIDGSNSLALFQPLLDSCGNILIAGVSNYMNNSNNNNTQNNNNLNLNMFLDKCKDVQDMVDYIDTLNFTKQEMKDMMNPAKPIGECMASLLNARLIPVPVEKRSIHFVPGDEERPPVYIVRDKNAWVRENPTAVQREIEDIEVYECDKDVEINYPHLSRDSLPKKSAMNKVSEKLGDKIYYDCKKHFPGKENHVIHASRCTGRSEFVGALTHKNGVLLENPNAPKQPALKGPTV